MPWQSAIESAQNSPKTRAPKRAPGTRRDKENDVFGEFSLQNPLPALVIDRETSKFLSANKAAEKCFGLVSAELVHWPVQRVFEALDASFLSSGGSIRTMCKLQDGGESQVDLHANPVTYRGRNALYVLVVPVPEYTEADAHADVLKACFRRAQVPMILTDGEGVVRSWNLRAEQLYEWSEEEAIGKTISDLLQSDPETVASACQSVVDHGEWAGELRQVNKSGQPISVNSRWTGAFQVDGTIHSILMIDLDITAQKDLEAQYLRSQRLESIGTLASGIAHDLNNILTPILMSVGILRTRHIDADSMKLLVAIEGSAERGAGIVRQVLTFARGVAGEKMLLQPRHLVNEVAKILSQTLPKNIPVRNQMPRDLWMIFGDATQIHQVLLNLCVNARDAMPDGGTLFLVADNVLLDGKAHSLSPEAKPGPHVLLQVTDTGSGIPENVIHRMYDPFFSTKDPGKGTGLGLSTARGIVKNHNGFMVVDTEIGKGTTFKVFLPASIGSETKQDERHHTALPRANGELILVVDDEAAVRAAAVRTLEGHGYRVYTAEDGSDALALYFQRRSEIALVLTDYTMEQMDGLHLAQALKRLDPQVKIVVSSGQCGEERIASFHSSGITAFLDKPYKPEQLLSAVHEELQKHPAR